MQAIIAVFAVLTFVAQATPDTSPTPAPSPSPSSSPASGKQTLRLDIPPGWRRIESGQYNDWRSPDGTADFRVAITGVVDDLHGPNAADVVKKMFLTGVAASRPNASVTVQKIFVCDGTQPAYRIDDPLGIGSPAFMVLVPGTKSSGLVNYEIHPGGKQDPAILATIDKLCWP